MASQFAETIDSPLEHSTDSVPPLTKRHPMALVEGNTPHLSDETDALLRNRLRIAALLLFAGFLAFFIKSLFYLDQITATCQHLLFWDHLLVTCLAGALVLGLCRNCGVSLVKLRFAELLMFGGAAQYFMFVNYVEYWELAQRGVVAPNMSPWLLLIFTYALFIPNTWRRAAIVVGGIALLPVLVMVWSWWNIDHFAQLAVNGYFGGVLPAAVMVLVLASTISVSGVATIGSLRRQAFQARMLGQYRLKHLIGAGGMGDVYLAEHQLLKRPCAIKVIHPEKAGDPRAMARFEREVQSAARLTHWNSIEIYDYGSSDDGTFYYVMEYLPGLNLQQMVELHGPLPPGRVIHLLRQTCDALEEAHQRDLIHRDLKPGNIFAANRGGIYDVAKLLDFGLVKTLHTDVPELTQEGSIAGSPLYMAPEQAGGTDAADARTDVYALGGVAYYLLTGEPPFARENTIKVLIAHAHETVTPLSELRPDIPEDLEAVVMRCLEKDPDHRYQSAAQLAEALAHCEDAGSWTRQDAACWWGDHGCPKKRALDQQVVQEPAFVG